MRRALVIGVGVLELLAPRRVIRFGERLAFSNPEDGQLRSRTVPIARLEGVVFVWLVGREEGLPAGSKAVLATAGIVMAQVPQSVVEMNLHLAYENADELELKRWVVPLTRLLGVVSLLAGLFATPVDTPTDSDAPRRDGAAETYRAS
ncbi:hypothetical protein [Natrinema pallidum]|uniref:Uncharacterized protein n=2 Tax=Natrinema pallidum TaxID=69527 RepID=A0A4P9TJC0_9EURY|nr:hypothetical protein [Natrinema pallidum]QCW04867.1 hypothetical protein FGF80_17305 [Natrinema pallidum]